MMGIKKIVIAGLMTVGLASNANAWLLDGDNYVMFNAGFSSGTIEKDTISSQSLGLELGRNFSADWYSSLLVEYAVYNIETSNSNIEIGLRATTAAVKVGYRPTKTTLLYGMAGMAGTSDSFGPLLGGGARWEIFDQLAIFGEYRRISVSSNSGIDDAYAISSGTAGIQLYFRY